MNLKQKIKQSGLSYFETHAPDVPIGQNTISSEEIAASPVLATPKKKNKQLLWSFGSAGTALVGIAIVAVVLLTAGPKEYLGLEALNAVNYPQDREVNKALVSSDHVTHIRDFAFETTQGLYSDDTANLVYSPISAYYALSLLLEAARGDTYTQLADTLGVSDIQSLRSDSQNLYKNLYYDFKEGSGDNYKYATSKIANGVFVNNLATVKQDYLDTLATEYFAEVFHTAFDADSKKGIADWLNDKTNDFLDVVPEDLHVDTETLYALYNTIYMKESWVKGFEESMTEEATFTTTDSGATQRGDFMYGLQPAPYFSHDEYESLSLGLYGGSKVIFVLPQSGYLPSDIIQSSVLLNQILDEMANATETNDVVARVGLPKGKTVQKYSLKETLQANGVIDVFTDASDLGNAVDGAFVESIIQKVGVEFTEAGAEAAAYTEVDVGETAMPSNGDLDFILNHSFLYFIVSPDGVPSFIGVTNTLS